LVKSRYLQYINHEENPYGENAIVAIMCYTGYNVEDAVLINESALQRGLFRTTYYTTYEAHEEREIKHDIVMKDVTFSNVSTIENIKGMKPDYDYSQLNEHGLIVENTPVDDKTILIGKSTLLQGETGERKDCSKVPKKGQMGMVDKSFMTQGEEGQRVAKVRIREERIPTFGDKFASRAGQKGTVGMVIPEMNMPFTKNGLRPDMIINPHALPSRMTIGQMIESITGKACTLEGTAGECTAFYNRENKLGMFGELLTKHHFHSSGDEIMYDGFSGKQLEASIFIGPTYYMRLKHMVKDKINYRATGPLTNLTRQPVHGRANDGGLRIGEMERDAVISHGMSHFLRESMMSRADQYKLAICNKSGTIAIYNKSKDLLISPSADGPLQYSGSVEKDNAIEVNQITKHGRSFSIVEVPYSMKLLIQELQAIGVQIHLITDDNVNQMNEMKFSHNIDLLLGKENATPQMIIEQITESIRTADAAVEVEDINVPVNQGIPYDYTQPIPRDMVGKYPDMEVQGYAEDEKQLYLTFTPKEKRAFNQYDLVNRKKSLRYQVDKQAGLINESRPASPEGPPPGYFSASASNRSQEEASSSLPTMEQDVLPENIPVRSETDSVLQKGGKVFYNGDANRSRLWDIVGINPDGTYTINTDDLYDGLNIADSRKIVSEKDIRIPDLFDYNPLEQKHAYFDDGQSIVAPGTDPAEGYPVSQPPNSLNGEQKPMVNIIKIFNQGGQDYSVNDDSHTQPEQPTHLEPVGVDTSSIVNNSNPSSSIVPPSPSPSDAVDFKHLVIDKLK